MISHVRLLSRRLASSFREGRVPQCFTALLLATVVVGCPPPDAVVTITPSTLTVEIGATDTFLATSTSGEDTSFTWSSVNAAIATVDQNGVVTGVAEGSTTITAEGDSSGSEDTATVNVTGPTAVVTITPSTLTVEIGATDTFLATSTSDEDTSFTWSSVNAAIATVDQNGVVTGVAEGSTTITAEGDSSGSEDTATVTVTGPDAVVTIMPSTLTLEIDATDAFEATSTSAEDTSFMWSSENEDIATVDQDGLVTGVGEGATTIMAKGASSASEDTAIVIVTRPAGNLGPLDLQVDPEVTPQHDALPPLAVGDDPRPLAAVEDARGNRATFVENEIILVTDDGNAVADFATRWNGEVLMTIERAPDVDMPLMHLVRVDTSLGDPSQLTADLLALDPIARGANGVSSDAGLNLIAISAMEENESRKQANGMMVGINWVGETMSLESRSTTEAPTGPSGFSSGAPGYTNNAFLWNHLDNFGEQEIGVTDAWELLAKGGRLSNRVQVAILDMGFSVDGNADIAGDFIAISNVPFFDPIGTENLLSCTGGADCPYHGTEVLSAAMAIPDNAFGGAGPGGPVAQPIMVFTLYDFFTSIQALNDAAFLGADVANMSYGAAVPAYLFFTVLPFEVATFALSQFMVITAAAGNDGRNVDAEDCVDLILGTVCWEEAWHTPCENAGVLCVGGLGKNSNALNLSSNFGREQVDIFAPYSVIVGPDPSTGPGAHQKNGTSFSAPYIAGVAALVLAADPSLSADEVCDIIIDTAHLSPDDRVERWVDAYAAVSSVMPSFIAIEGPAAVEAHLGLSVGFQAFVFDASGGAPTVTWTSSIDGPLGAGINITVEAGLSLGIHTITAVAALDNRPDVQDSVTVNVFNTPPTVDITSPMDDAQFFQGQPILLAATSEDINFPPNNELTDAQVSWFVDDVLLGSGHARLIAAGTLSLGPHTIRFDGNDGTATTSDSVSIMVNENPPDLPPDVVNITNPMQGVTLPYDVFNPTLDDFRSFVSLEGNASDPEDGTLTGDSLVWTVSRNGEAAVLFGTGSPLAVELRPFGGSETTHDITLTAMDSAGNTTTATIRVFQAQIILK